MRALATVALLAAACTEHGSHLPGTEPGDGFETPRFQPLVCTAGTPADPTCPVNNVDLSAGGAPARFAFILQVVSGGTVLSDATMTAFDEGLVLENLALHVWTTDGMATELPFGTSITLGPGDIVALNAISIVGEGTHPLSLHASAAGPLH